jgi:hypothetical protein
MMAEGAVASRGPVRGSGKDSGGTDGKDSGSGNNTRRELWRIISGSEVRFMWNFTMADKIQTTGDREGNDGNKQR